MRILQTICIALTIAFCSGTAQAAPPIPFPKTISISLSPIEALTADEKLAEGVDLMLVEPGEQLSSLRGTLSEPLAGNIQANAEKFIREHGTLFNAPSAKSPARISCARKTRTAGADHVSFQMTVGNVPVRDSLVDVHIGKSRIIELVNGSFPTLKNVSNRVVLTPEQSVDLARNAIDATELSGPPHSELEILPTDGDGLLVYCVRISSKRPLGDFEVLIDAENGREVSRQNLMVYSRGDGMGAVYTSNPMHGNVSKERLPHLTSHTLKGEFADVINEDADCSVATDDVHVYDPDNTHFDEVNVYYNINRIHDFFRKLGCTMMDKPIKAIVHYGDDFDNAAYRPFENTIIFGDGKLRRDYAKEECICWHEYSHAVLQQIVKLFYSSESGAMNEGQADYFACSLSNDPKYGEWVASKMGQPYERTIENNLHYPEDIKGEVHADGQLWSGALWELRTALGADIADLLIFKSFYYLKSGSPRFMNGVNAILTADKNLFGGKHAKDITAIFDRRGFNRVFWGGAYGKKDIAKVLMFQRMHRE